MSILSILKVIIAGCFILVLPSQVYALTPDQVFDKVKDSVVVVKTLDAQGNVRSQGSGVLLPSLLIATNCHVVNGGASYQIGQGKELVPATLFAEDVDKDICLLNAKGYSGKPTQLGNTENLKVGAPVYAVGAPQGLELSLSNGIVAQLRDGPPPLIQTTAAISPGSSGGGLFDGEGRLVGLTTLYVKGGQNLNFAMPVEWIQEIKPGRSRIDRENSKVEWVKGVIALEEAKDWKGILVWSLKWTKMQPENAAGWFCLAAAYEELKRPSEAIDAYNQSLRIQPENYIVWYNLAIIYARLQRYNEAIDALQYSLRINPENTDVWYLLGLVYSLSGNNAAALNVANELRRLDPKKAYDLFSKILPR